MARGYANVKFEWNGSHSAVIQNLGFGKGLQRDAAEIIYQHGFKYIPYLSGDLATNVHIQATEDHANIVHTVKYANKQWENSYPNRYRLVHPLATDHWYNFAWANEKKQITQEVDEARLKYRRR